MHLGKSINSIDDKFDFVFSLWIFNCFSINILVMLLPLLFIIIPIDCLVRKYSENCERCYCNYLQSDTFAMSKQRFINNQKEKQQIATFEKLEPRISSKVFSWF